MRNKISLGAARDNPAALADRASHEAAAANRRKDTVGLREAAEIGWLAASSTADVAASKMGLKIPKGASGRRAVLTDLEQRAKLGRGTLVTPFEAARTVLHGECFHGDICSVESVHGVIDSVSKMAHTAAEATSKLRGRRG
jgi:hypothetical protein